MSLPGRRALRVVYGLQVLNCDQMRGQREFGCEGVELRLFRVSPTAQPL
jgi:hypothetical protein